MKEFGSQKLIIHKITVINENLTNFPACEKMTAFENLTIFPDFIEQGLLLVHYSAYMGRSTPTTAFDGLT